MPISFTSQIVTTYKAADKSGFYKKMPSPYSDQGPSGLFGFGVKQPYIYIYPNDGKKGLNGLKRYEDTGLPLGDGPQDLMRITKMMGSGTGIKFLLNQTMLQANAAYNETRLFNPLMPIQAAARAASMFSLPRPTRSIDVSSISGILSTFTNGLIGGGIYNPVAGTTGNIPSDSPDGTKAYAGLLRFATANKGKTHFSNVYTATAGTSNLFSNAISQLSGPVAAISNTITGIMSVFSNPQQITVGGKPAVYRSDEDAYTTLISSMPSKILGSVQKYTNTLPAISTNSSQNQGSYEFINKDNSPINVVYDEYPFDIINQKNTNAVIGLNYGEDSPENQKLIQTSLERLLNNIDASKGYDKDYSLGELSIVSSTREDGIDSIKKIGAYMPPTNGYEASFDEKDPTLLTNKGFQRNGLPDKINILTVMNSSQFGYGIDYVPYQDDQIAFYFHDFVNDRYIPFRSTVKGITEQNTAEWDDVSYVGRADKLYNYKGFIRQLNFNFQIVISSIKELLPTWTRINYLMTMVKPAGYKDIDFVVSSEKLTYTSKFVIPPLVGVTIGNLYQEQPIVITQLSCTIPDDALWETLSEDYAENNLWDYLNGRIIWNDSIHNYAQFPMECEITVGANILEQTFPQMGQHNFGWFKSLPGTFSKQLIVGAGTPVVNNQTINVASPVSSPSAPVSSPSAPTHYYRVSDINAPLAPTFVPLTNPLLPANTNNVFPVGGSPF